MLITYIIDITDVRFPADGSFGAFVEDQREIRITSDQPGFFGTAGEITNPDNDGVISLLRDPVIGTFSDARIFTLAGDFSFAPGAEPAQITFGALEPLDADGDTVVSGGPLFVILGPQFPALADGTDFLGLQFGETPNDAGGVGFGTPVAWDSLPGVERLGDFSGGIGLEDARTVALLYEAQLGRQPEAEGLNFWLDTFEGGLALTEIAQFFIDSIEFQDRFGDIDSFSNQQYVDTLYQNVLDRPGEDAGVAFWTSVLDDGSSRADMLVFFVQSDENAAAVEYVFDLDEVTEGEWAIV